jgi:four helix bundle protein
MVPAAANVMNQWREQMKVRTHKFAVDVITFVKTLPDRTETHRLRDRLVGAACGVDGNWHAACRARTHKEFAAKLGIVVEEADEAEEWLDVMHDTKVSQADELKQLRRESKELRAIFAKASRTANENEQADRARKARKKGRRVGR